MRLNLTSSASFATLVLLSLSGAQLAGALQASAPSTPGQSASSPASGAPGSAGTSPAPASSGTTAADAPATTQTHSATGTASDLPDSPFSQVPPTPQPTGPTVVFDTSMGRMTCRLYSKLAPEASANFVGLAEGTKDWTDPATHAKMHGKPLYDGTTFHRVIPGFMIQGGDPIGTGMGDPGYFFNDEIDPALTFDAPGKLAMANSGPNTNGSQFFITTAPSPHLNGHYTEFGECDAPSVTVAQTIASVERDPQDKPLTPVTLNKVTVVPAGAPVPPPPAAPAAPASGAAGSAGPHS